MRTSRLAMSALLAAIILAGGAFTVFAAPALQHAQPAAAKPKTATPANGAKAQQYCDSFLKDFAGKLGVDPKKVVPALRDSIKDGIDQAVTNGDLTAEQATKFKTKVDGVQGCSDLAKMGELAPAARPHAAAGLGAPRLMEVVTAAAATALKVPAADLQKDVMAGDSLSKIAGTTGVDKPTFDASFRTALTTQLDADVAAKKMTKAQETEMVDQAVKMADKLWDTSLNGLGGGLFGHAGRKPVPPGPPPPPPPPPPVQ